MTTKDDTERLAEIRRYRVTEESPGSWATLVSDTQFLLHLLDAATSGREPFQKRVNDWIQACFGPEIGADRIERNHRLFEESTEAVQANGMTRSECHQLVDYTFDRPVGELRQEVGGVLNTLAALCTASGVDMDEAGEIELRRVWTKVEAIRAKQSAKPKHSPLPEASPPAASEERAIGQGE